MPFVKCLNCGKEFYVPPYKIREGKGKFCSMKCYSEYLRKTGLRKGENNPSWKGGKVKKICLNCGKEFHVKPARADKAKFCSLKCYGEWKSKYHTGENSPNYKGKIKKVCPVCGREFYVYPYQAKTAKFCSKECRSRRIIKKCLNCGKEFEVPYCKKDKQVFCSLTCKINYRANHFELNQHIIEYIDGLLLGDGCLHSYKDVSASYTQSITIKHIEWAEKIKQYFEHFGIESFIKIYNPKNSYTQNQMVRIRTKNYREFIYFKKRWYLNGKKIVPRDIKLTPITVLNWYLGDGSLCKNEKSGSYSISLNTQSFTINDVNFLVNLLKKTILIKPTIILEKKKYPVIRIYRKRDVKRFLKYIGDPPVKCFEYKWKII